MSHASLLVAVAGLDDIEAQVEFQMAPFDENGEFFKDGSRWDWFVIGGRYEGRFGDANIVQIKQLNLAALRAQREAQLREGWREAQEREEQLREMLYGIQKGETEATYVARKMAGSDFPPFHSFLKDRQWHESERMGWFGMPAQTECAALGRDKGKCLHHDKATGARVISWNESQENWAANFYRRFVKPLDENITLVTVDYHV